MTEAIIYPCQTCINIFFIIADKKKMVAEILTKWRPKWPKLEGKMCTGYIMAVGKVSPGRGI